MNLNATIKKFIHENNFQKLSERIVIIRYDGISIYSNAQDDFESATICALVSGLWQAAKQLNTLIDNDNDFFEHRLSFDTTANGLYILPIKIFKEEYFVCSLYKDISNPAKLKRDLRQLKEKLELHLEGVVVEQKIDRSGYLFKNITDEEIDKIFEYGV